MPKAPARYMRYPFVGVAALAPLPLNVAKVGTRRAHPSVMRRMKCRLKGIFKKLTSRG